MNKYVIAIYTDGCIHIESIHGAEISDTLTELQKLVGGYLEAVHLEDNLMLVNEDGISEGLELNNVASALYGSPIFGNAVLLKEGKEDFEFFTNEEACDTLAKVFDFNLGIVREDA